MRVSSPCNARFESMFGNVTTCKFGGFARVQSDAWSVPPAFTGLELLLASSMIRAQKHQCNAPYLLALYRFAARVPN